MRSMSTRSRDTCLKQSLPDLDSLLFVNAPSSSNEPPQMAIESVGLGGKPDTSGLETLAL